MHDDQTQSHIGAQASDQRQLTPELLRLLTAARVGEPAALDHLVAQVSAGLPTLDAPQGTDLLLFMCGSVACAALLSGLREVIPHLPACAMLPFSPPWLLGVFPLRSEMLGLVDPAPQLLGIASSESYVPVVAPRQRPSDALFPSPPTGQLGLSMTLVAGDGTHQLGLAVSAVGDAVLAVEEEIVVERDAPPREASPIHERYIAGIYTPRQTQDHYTILHIERLLDDLIHALDRSEEEGHG
jgi:chemotaxis signal transduction protein